MTIREITKSLVNKEYSSPDDIRTILHSMEKIMSIPNLILNDGIRLYRARLVDDNSRIKSSKDLSYVPQEYNKTYKRASTPNNTMFYGISGESHSDMICGCLAETCECLRIPNSPNKHYNVVIGIWETTKDLTLPQILNIDGNNRSTAFSNSRDYKEILESFKDVGCDLIDFWRFMNHEFSKYILNGSKHEYWVSAVFSEWLTKYMGYDGIIYESVQSTDPKLKDNHCVALLPKVADTSLKFCEALQIEFDFNGGEIILPKPKQFNIPKDY